MPLQGFDKVAEVFELDIDIECVENYLFIQSLIGLASCRGADHQDCLKHVYLIIIFESLNGRTCHTLGLKVVANL